MFIFVNRIVGNPMEGKNAKYVKKINLNDFIYFKLSAPIQIAVLY